MEVHEPYYHPSCFTESARFGLLPKEKEEILRKKWRKGYERNLRFLKTHLLPIIDKILKEAKNTTILITSDHGQLLGEDGLFGHTIWLKEELLRIPLWIREKVSENVRSLVYFPQLILNLLNGEQMKVSDLVFSESFGITKVTPEIERILGKDLERFTVHRVAAITDSSFLVFNEEENKVEHFRGRYSERRKLVEKVKDFLSDPESFSPGVFP